jgi:hypothetical protein
MIQRSPARKTQPPQPPTLTSAQESSEPRSEAAGEWDIPDLVEKVYAQVRQRLALERERLGRNR